jgi:hypothetical protein
MIIRVMAQKLEKSGVLEKQRYNELL